jgi:adenylate cyclase
LIYAARSTPSLNNIDEVDAMKPRRTLDEEWAALLSGTHPLIRMGRSMFGLIPSSPRCKLCYAPFHGLGGRVMRLMGKGPWERNPTICEFCFKALTRQGAGGAEVELSLVFADIRGSTALAENMSPREYGELINGFFKTATEIFVKYDAIIDQLVGDEAIGLFIPAYAGTTHARQAIEAGCRLIEAMMRKPDPKHALQLGVGVHTGVAFVGCVGTADSLSDFTALGDPVNTAARLASAASAGEVLVSEAARLNAGLDLSGSERRQLALKGKAELFEVSVLHDWSSES